MQGKRETQGRQVGFKLAHNKIGTYLASKERGIKTRPREGDVTAASLALGVFHIQCSRGGDAGNIYDVGALLLPNRVVPAEGC